MNHQIIRLFHFTISLATLLLIVACADTQTITPDAPQATRAPTRRAVVIPTTPAGWTPYNRSTYQIALPDSWQEIRLSETELKNAITSAQENNPPLAEQLRALLESGQYNAFVFYAIEKNGAGILRNVSITRLSLQGTNDLQAFAKSYADALPNIARGSKVIELQTGLQVNGMNAAGIVYDVSLVNQLGALETLRGVQFIYALDSGAAYLVTVTGSAHEAEKFMPLARRIATAFVGVTP